MFSTDVVKTSVSRISVPRRMAVHTTTRLKDVSSLSRAIRSLLLRNSPKYNAFEDHLILLTLNDCSRHTEFLAFWYSLCVVILYQFLCFLRSKQTRLAIKMGGNKASKSSGITERYWKRNVFCVIIPGQPNLQPNMKIKFYCHSHYCCYY